MLTAFILSLLLVSALIEEGTGLYSLVCACHKGHLDRVREEVHSEISDVASHYDILGPFLAH